MSAARQKPARPLPVIPRPRNEAVFVFGVAICASVVIGVGLGGGLSHRSSGLKLARSANTLPTTAFVANTPSADPRTGTKPRGASGAARRHASRDRHSAAERAAAARRAAARRAAARRGSAERAAAKRRAAQRKAARARSPQRRRPSPSPPRTIAVRTRSYSPTHLVVPVQRAPTTTAAPVRTAPKSQPAPAVQFNETGTSPSTGGTVQFDQSGSGTTP